MQANDKRYPHDAIKNDLGLSRERLDPILCEDKMGAKLCKKKGNETNAIAILIAH